MNKEEHTNHQDSNNEIHQDHGDDLYDDNPNQGTTQDQIRSTCDAALLLRELNNLRMIALKKIQLHFEKALNEFQDLRKINMAKVVKNPDFKTVKDIYVEPVYKCINELVAVLNSLKNSAQKIRGIELKKDDKGEYKDTICWDQLEISYTSDDEGNEKNSFISNLHGFFNKYKDLGSSLIWLCGGVKNALIEKNDSKIMMVEGDAQDHQPILWCMYSILWLEFVSTEVIPSSQIEEVKDGFETLVPSGLEFEEALTSLRSQVMELYDSVTGE